MDINPGDDYLHADSGFQGIAIARANGSPFEYYQYPGRRNIPVVALMSGQGEVRFFDGAELTLVERDPFRPAP